MGKKNKGGWKCLSKFAPGDVESEGQGKPIEERLRTLERHVDILHEKTLLALSTPQIKKILEQFDLCPHCNSIITRISAGTCEECGKLIR